MKAGRLLLLAVGLTPACSLIVSTSDLSSGGPSTPDAGSDGSFATADAAADADADAGSFSCATVTPAPRFCSEFATGAFNSKAWDDTNTAGGAFAVDNGSLVASTAPTGDSFRSAYAEQDFNAATSFHLASDVRIDKAETTDASLGARFIGLHQANSTWNAMVGSTGDGGLIVSENWSASGATKRAIHGTGKYTAGVWFHVEVDVDLSQKRFAVTVDGTVISDGAPLVGPFDLTATGALVGLYYAPVSAAGWSIRFDNVVIDGK